jgi:RNA polymerase sigma-70 factor (ECF subfamily)
VMTSVQERQYIQQARTDPRAFAPIYDHYFPRVHAYVCYRVHDPQHAEDIVADTFLKAIRNLRRFKWRSDHSFAAWLFRIAHNLVVDHYREHKRFVLALVSEDSLAEPASEAPLPEEALAQQEAFEQVRTLVATLSPRRQEIVTLRFYAGLRNREIARVLGLGERTVAAHLCRALQDLERKYTATTKTELATEVVT